MKEQNTTYKQTEIGVIPSDWEVKTLETLGKFSKGSGVRKDEAMSGEIPCVRYGELYTKHNDYIKQFNSFISIEISKTAKKLKTGDILFAGSGETKEEIGKSVAFVDEFMAYAGGDIVILSPSNVNSLLLGFLLNSPEIQKQKSSKGQGDAVVHISATQLGTIQIPLPPTLAEQTAIANALSDADSYIASLEKLIAKKRLIKQGAMQQLLKPKEGWKVKKLGEICVKIQDGNYGASYPKSNEFVSIGIPFLTSKAIGNDGVLKENLIDYITKEKHLQLSKAHLALYDILFTNRGASVGTIGFVDVRISNGNIGPQLTLLRANPILVSPFYLYQSMKSNYFQNQIIGQDSGSAMNFFGIGSTMKFNI